MPHKYVTKDLLVKLEDQISEKSREIAFVKSISRRDKEGIDNFLARLKVLLDSSRQKKDTALDGLMEDGRGHVSGGQYVPAGLLESRTQEKMALIFRGEEKMAEAIIEMFENPDAAVSTFVQERDEIQKRLEQYRQMEQREQ